MSKRKQTAVDEMRVGGEGGGLRVSSLGPPYSTSTFFL